MPVRTSICPCIVGLCLALCYAQRGKLRHPQHACFEPLLDKATVLLHCARPVGAQLCLSRSPTLMPDLQFPIS